MKPLLVIDCSALARAAYYTMGSLSYKDVRTGIIFGFFKEIVALMDQFGSDTVVFCFDAKGSLRKEVFPDYKKKRHTRELDENEKLALFELKRQITKLRDDYLPTVGYNNVFWRDGFEADDVIATTVAQVPDDGEAIIIGADKDLWQLIRANVRCYNPTKAKMMTLHSFTQKFGIPPKRWAQKLSIAGCKTDEVPGIPGVGETLALRYIRGEMKPESKVFKRIESERGIERIARNRALVKLPYAGTPVFKIRPDSITTEGWERVCVELGMKSLAGKAPVMGREHRRPRVTRDGFGL